MNQSSLIRGTFAGLVVATLTACSGEALFYRTDGTYTADVTTESAPTTQMSLTLGQANGPISAKGTLRMCNLTEIAWNLPSGPQDVGEPAAIRTTLATSLCEIGTKTITSGKMIVWGPAPNSPGITGVVSDEWTVTGTITVTEYNNLHPAEPSLDEELLSERAVGTVSLTATTSDGRMVKIENGTFTFLIYTRKSEYHPFS